MSKKEIIPNELKGFLKKMPDRVLLEQFLLGLSGTVTVQFDTDLGEFVMVKKPTPPEDEPKA